MRMTPEILKVTTWRAFRIMGWPVWGLRPWRDFFLRTVNLPKPLMSTWFSVARVVFMISITDSTCFRASRGVKFVSSVMRETIFSFVTVMGVILEYGRPARRFAAWGRQTTAGRAHGPGRLGPGEGKAVQQVTIRALSWATVGPRTVSRGPHGGQNYAASSKNGPEYRLRAGQRRTITTIYVGREAVSLLTTSEFYTKTPGKVNNLTSLCYQHPKSRSYEKNRKTISNTGMIGRPEGARIGWVRQPSLLNIIS